MPVGDDELACQLAEEAGRRLLVLREQRPAGPAGGDGKALGQAGDRLSHEFLTSELAVARPQDAILSEEGADDLARLSAHRVWIIDPLDGTREFGEAGRTDWAVHVALWQDGELTAGAVALPAQGSTLSTAAPPRRPAGEPGKMRVLVSRSRPPQFGQAVAESLGAELVPMGSAGAKAAAVITGAAAAYVHSGGQYEWDSAAPVAVALAAGLHVSRTDGSPLRYNQANPYLPDIVICPSELAESVLAAISAAPGGAAPGQDRARGSQLPAEPERT